MTGTGTSFEELSEARCHELLAGQTTGRVAWNAPDGPQVLPVSYAMDVGDIVFRTSPYGALSQLRVRTNVAFEIDDIDAEHGTGWSVLVRGSAQAVLQPRQLERLWSDEATVPWAAGTRNLFIAITPRAVTGRIVRRPWSSPGADT
jgi:nitroimidazol reductase NimA-like FMN-containing flavoprotein (pyridoxamine 5'-phosphate oxidase superfamily)